MNKLTHSFAPSVPNNSAAALTGQAFLGYSCAGYSIYVVSIVLPQSIQARARHARAEPVCSPRNWTCVLIYGREEWVNHHLYFSLYYYFIMII